MTTNVNATPNATLNVLGRVLLGAMLSGIVPASVALAQTQDPTQPPTQPMRDPQRTPPATQGVGRPSASDIDFLKDAVDQNNAEIEASRIAVGKTRNAQVKALAQKMVDEHTATRGELQALAGTRGVDISTDPTVVQKGKLAILSARDADTFDRHYLDTLVDAHKDMIELFQKAAANSGDTEVMTFATRTLPALRQHLQMAQRLRQDQPGSGR